MPHWQKCRTVESLNISDVEHQVFLTNMFFSVLYLKLNLAIVHKPREEGLFKKEQLQLSFLINK